MLHARYIRDKIHRSLRQCITCSMGSHAPFFPNAIFSYTPWYQVFSSIRVRSLLLPLESSAFSFSFSFTISFPWVPSSTFIGMESPCLPPCLDFSAFSLSPSFLALRALLLHLSFPLRPFLHLLIVLFVILQLVAKKITVFQKPCSGRTIAVMTFSA